MRKLLKYLFIFIVAAVFWDRAGACVSAAETDAGADTHVSESVIYTTISASDSELCPPRQVSLTNTVRVQSTARRTNGVQRNNIEFTKAGKVINTGQRYFIQKKSIMTHSSLIEPAHKLHYLGKLII